MKSRLLLVFAIYVLVPVLTPAQSTIYWKKDHIYDGPDGKELALVTPPPADTTAPSTPTGLSVTGTTATTVSLQWTSSTDSGGSGLAGYKVYRQRGSGAIIPVGTVSDTTGNGTSTFTFTDAPLASSTAYHYTVVAFDKAQNHSTATSSVTGTTTSVENAQVRLDLNRHRTHQNVQTARAQ